MNQNKFYMQRVREEKQAKIMTFVGNALGLLLGGVLVAGTVIITVIQ